MSIYGLTRAFTPQSIAIVGASPKPKTLGGAVYANAIAAGFAGRIDPVNPNYGEIGGRRCVASLDGLDAVPDLVVIATPAATVPAIVETAAQRGSGTAIVLSAGLGHGEGSLAERMHAPARARGLRIIGPNCLGVIAPHAALNASFAAVMPERGALAVISQSGAIAAAMAEWGMRHDIGFSAIVSLGDQLDVDVGDLLDYFALDPATQAILLYVESVKESRKFMSAARAAARVKPVVVIKSGRHDEGKRAAATHTGALAGSDAVYDAAFRRAGLLRVQDMAELFAAARTLAHYRGIEGNRLAILTNGGGFGVLAVDSLVDQGYRPAGLSDEATARLDAAMPPIWSRANPVDIIGDADAQRYIDALSALIDDPQNDAIVVLNVQTALASSLDTAKAVSEFVVRQRSRNVKTKPVLTSWLGAPAEIEAVFRTAHVPHFATEIEAVRGFAHLARRGDLLKSLMARPAAAPDDFKGDEAAVRAIVDAARGDNRDWLDPFETGAVLRAYGIPTIPLRKAADPDAAAQAAHDLLADGCPVAVKILSRDIQHKSDVDGVRLNLTSEADIRKAAQTVIANARRIKPDARIEGVFLQPMILRPRARELIAGLARDPIFGAVIVFGHGGVAVEIVKDKAIALPPLDEHGAQELIGRTRIARLLEAYRNVPAARRDEVARVLVRLSQLAADIPEILEVDLNPLLADEQGVVALDARISIDVAPNAAGRPRHAHFAIRPYPKEWERRLDLRDGRTVAVRPVRPEDEPLYEDFFRRVTPEDMRLRFFGLVKDIGHAFIAKLTQIDYGRSIALLALDESGALIGVVRLHADPDHRTGEYAILLRSDQKGHGLGYALMLLIIEYAQKEGLSRIHGQVLRDNATMLTMCRELGFSVEEDRDDPGLVAVSLDLATTRTAPS
ncbi:bifunctional acetate--CoA ligase family protein/GNAT family N-acetyltransferase [Pseudorhodoplanes sp.]|uniref:bifunctional acetate--CoA ligase family protein/GNAT family N-acetyltransferase n=1 Tax=Pseudorhodoplanes sp. TaxID=1934341 RepID=UPI00391CA1FC